MKTRKSVFICYAHEDEAYKIELRKHLKWLERIEVIGDVWDDGSINAGQEWATEIDTHIKECDVAILLVSIDFLTSEFIQSTEIRSLQHRRKTEGIHIIPIIVRSCPWQDHDFLRDLQVLPGTEGALADFYRSTPEHDKAYTDIAKQLRAIIEESAIQVHSGRIRKAKEYMVEATGDLQRDPVTSARAACDAIKLLLKDLEPNRDELDKDDIDMLRKTTATFQVSMLRQHYSRLLAKLDVDDHTVNDVTFDASTGALITASDTKGIQIWEPMPSDSPSDAPLFRKEPLLLRSDETTFYGVSCDKHGRIAASSFKNIVVWNSRQERGTPHEYHQDRVNCVTFSSDGELWASASDDKKVCVAKGQERRYYEYNGAMNSVAFHPGGDYVATAGWDHTVRILHPTPGANVEEITAEETSDQKNREELDNKIHASAVNDVTFSSDGRRLVSASWDGTARQWSFAEGKLTDERILRGHTRRVNAAAFSQDDRLIATGSWDRTAKIWDAQSGTELFSLRGHTQPITALAFSREHRLATASFDGTVRIWDIGTERRLLPLVRSTERLIAAELTEDDENLLLIVSDVDGSLRIQSVSVRPPYRLGGVVRLEFNGKTMLTALSVDKKSRIVAAGYANGKMHIWKIPKEVAESGAKCVPIASGALEKGEGEGIDAIALFAANQQMVIGTEDGWISSFRWTDKDKCLKKTLEAEQLHSGPIYDLTFDDYGRHVASAGWDGRCTIFDILDPKIGKHTYPLDLDLKRPLKFSTVAFQPGSDRIAVGGLDGVVRIWGADARAIKERMLPAHVGGITKIAFSPKGDYIAESGGDGVIRVWSVTKWEEAKMKLEIVDHVAEIIGISFTSDGERIITASEDGLFLLSGINDESVVKVARLLVVDSDDKTLGV